MRLILATVFDACIFAAENESDSNNFITNLTNIYQLFIKYRKNRKNRKNEILEDYDYNIN